MQDEKLRDGTTAAVSPNKKATARVADLIFEMAHWTGVEPVTYRLEIGCSIQLSYRCA
jgi:hypothetical protein